MFSLVNDFCPLKLGKVCFYSISLQNKKNILAQEEIKYNLECYLRRNVSLFNVKLYDEFCFWMVSWILAILVPHKGTMTDWAKHIFENKQYLVVKAKSYKQNIEQASDWGLSGFPRQSIVIQLSAFLLSVFEMYQEFSILLTVIFKVQLINISWNCKDLFLIY